jgi:hypothetical protein
MLSFTRHFRRATIVCREGEVGSVSDVLFEDEGWDVRYIVVRLGPPLLGRKVLLSPKAFSGLGNDGRLATTLTLYELESSPAIEVDLPVSREKEIAIHQHFALPVYWGGPMALMPGSYTLGTPGIPNLEGYDLNAGGGVLALPGERPGNHLRSCDEARCYVLHTLDGEDFGEIEDFLVDETHWKVNALVLATTRWLPGREIIAPVDWVADFDWSSRRVMLKATREVVESAEEFSLDRVSGLKGANIDFRRAPGVDGSNASRNRLHAGG